MSALDRAVNPKPSVEERLQCGVTRAVRTVTWCEVAPVNSVRVAELLRVAGYKIYAAALDPDKEDSRFNEPGGTPWRYHSFREDKLT